LFQPSLSSFIQSAEKSLAMVSMSSIVGKVGRDAAR
jgi:ribonuclease HII